MQLMLKLTMKIVVPLDAPVSAFSASDVENLEAETTNQVKRLSLAVAKVLHLKLCDPPPRAKVGDDIGLPYGPTAGEGMYQGEQSVPWREDDDPALQAGFMREHRSALTHIRTNMQYALNSGALSGAGENGCA